MRRSARRARRIVLALTATALCASGPLLGPAAGASPSQAAMCAAGKAA